MAKENTPDNTTTLEFKQRKETKGTIVFEEMLPEHRSTDRPHQFYMLKPLHANLGAPSQIVMTIETQ